jgi:hypothetical protein
MFEIFLTFPQKTGFLLSVLTIGKTKGKTYRFRGGAIQHDCGGQFSMICGGQFSMKGGCNSAWTSVVVHRLTPIFVFLPSFRSEGGQFIMHHPLKLIGGGDAIIMIPPVTVLTLACG